MSFMRQSSSNQSCHVRILYDDWLLIWKVKSLNIGGNTQSLVLIFFKDIFKYTGRYSVFRSCGCLDDEHSHAIDLCSRNFRFYICVSEPRLCLRYEHSNGRKYLLIATWYPMANNAIYLHGTLHAIPLFQNYVALDVTSSSPRLYLSAFAFWQSLPLR